MARLGIEPRHPKYIPGALPIELPSLGYQTWIASFITLCGRLHIQQREIREDAVQEKWAPARVGSCLARLGVEPRRA